MSTFKKGKRIKSKKFFCTTDKMMYENTWKWAHKEGAMNVGEGDALWRTSLAYITWQDAEIKEGILGCFRKFGGNYHFKKEMYQVARSANRYGEDDVSRDQVTMAFAALHTNGDHEELAEFASKTPYKLSRRFKMTPDMWAWVKTFTNTKHKKFYVNVACFIGILEKFLAFNLNRLIALILGFKSIDNDDYTSRYHYDKRDSWNSFQKTLYRSYYFGYAFHLACWQYYTLPKDYNPILKRILRRIMIGYCEEQNFLCRILLGDKTVTWEQVESYVPKEGFRWQAYLDGSWANYHNEKSEEWKKTYLKHNQMDRDILIRMWNLEIGK